MEKKVACAVIFYVSVGLNFQLCQITCNWTKQFFLFSLICFRNLHVGSIVPDLACFVLFLPHDHISVKKQNIFLLFCGIKIANTAGVGIDEVSVVAYPYSSFLIFSLATSIIFHFQNGGDVTNPAGLSPCILPRKCKSGLMMPSRAKDWRQKSANPALFPPHVSGVNPPWWPLISALLVYICYLLCSEMI